MTVNDDLIITQGGRLTARRLGKRARRKILAYAESLKQSGLDWTFPRDTLKRREMTSNGQDAFTQAAP